VTSLHKRKLSYHNQGGGAWYYYYNMRW